MPIYCPSNHISRKETKYTKKLNYVLNQNVDVTAKTNKVRNIRYNYLLLQYK